MKKYLSIFLITLLFGVSIGCKQSESKSEAQSKPEPKQETIPELIPEPPSKSEVATPPVVSLKEKPKAQTKPEQKQNFKDKAQVRKGQNKNKKLVFKHLKRPFNNKKGIATTLRTPGMKKGKKVFGTYIQNMPKVAKLNVGWNYSWSSKMQPTQPKHTSFAPMVYSVYGQPAVQSVTDKLEAKIAPIRARQKQVVLFGYNEPDKKDQANLSVAKALKYWESLEDLNVPLCSPSTVHADNQWMKDFMKGVEKKKLRVNYIGVHDYGGGNAKQFKAKLRRIHEMYKRPIIVTEFAVADWNARSVEQNRHSKQKVMRFMKEVLPWMDKQDWIAGYAWFPFGLNSNVGTSSALFDGKGGLTELGEFYAGYKSR